MGQVLEIRKDQAFSSQRQRDACDGGKGYILTILLLSGHGLEALADMSLMVSAVPSDLVAYCSGGP